MERVMVNLIDMTEMLRPFFWLMVGIAALAPVAIALARRFGTPGVLTRGQDARAFRALKVMGRRPGTRKSEGPHSTASDSSAKSSKRRTSSPIAI
jgi:hypothetical protein